jgi:hypothetical protein
MTTDNFCFYLQNRLIETGGQLYSDTSPLVFPGGYNGKCGCSLKLFKTAIFVSTAE